MTLFANIFIETNFFLNVLYRFLDIIMIITYYKPLKKFKSVSHKSVHHATIFDSLKCSLLTPVLKSLHYPPLTVVKFFYLLGRFTASNFRSPKQDNRNTCFEMRTSFILQLHHSSKIHSEVWKLCILYRQVYINADFSIFCPENFFKEKYGHFFFFFQKLVPSKTFQTKQILHQAGSVMPELFIFMFMRDK